MIPENTDAPLKSDCSSAPCSAQRNQCFQHSLKSTKLTEQKTMETNMREIKFRAWNNSSKNFKTTDLAIRNDGPYILTYDWHNDYAKSWSSPYDTFIIQQYTGLKDKNGKEIYEGDFIHFGKQEGLYSDQVNRIIEVKYPFICGNAHLGEVIGNIFENKNLFEKEQ